MHAMGSAQMILLSDSDEPANGIRGGDLVCGWTVVDDWSLDGGYERGGLGKR